MDNNFANVSDYYKNIFSDITNNRYQPVGRLNFCVGAHFAVIWTIQKVVVSIFYLLLNVVTLGLKQSFRTSLMDNLKEGTTCLGAIPIGLAGVLFPETINQRVLQIPAEGLALKA